MNDNLERRHIITLALKGWIGRSEDRLVPEILARDVERVLTEDPHAPANIRFNCRGGLVSEAWDIHAVIGNHRGHVTAHVNSGCHSAGIIPYVAADLRTCTPWASFQFHDLRKWACDFSGAAQFTANDLRSIAADMDEQQARMVALLSERTSERGTYWRERMLPDPGWPVTAAEALSSGLAHAIEAPA
jgi:ATP-dependent protease ClpP protease subunit